MSGKCAHILTPRPLGTEREPLPRRRGRGRQKKENHAASQQHTPLGPVWFHVLALHCAAFSEGAEPRKSSFAFHSFYFNDI